MSIPFDAPKTWKHSMARIEKSRAGFVGLLAQQIVKMRLGERDRKRLRALSGYAALSGRLRNSHIDARCKFAEYVAEEVRRLAEHSDRTFFLLTLLADEGIMSIYEPELALRRLRGKAFRAMQALGLDGFYVIEVQALTNWSLVGKGGSLLAHVHAVSWRSHDMPPMTIMEMKDTLIGDGTRSNAAWTSALGARTVIITELDAQYGCPSYAAAYALKLPHDAKMRKPRKESDKFRLKSIIQGYRPNVAMRIQELFSHMLFGSNVGGVGEGAGIIKRCKDKAMRWAARRQEAYRIEGKSVEPFDEQALWSRTRRRGKPEHKPPFIH